LLHPLEIGDSSLLQVGEQVAAIGNPFGLSGSMTSGIVSQMGRLLATQDTGFSIPDVIQTDAAINPGNSGGPLLNMKGQVIGINTAIQSKTGEFIGIGFAIPSNTVSKIVPALIEDGKYHHPWIGITGKDIDPDLARVLELKQAKGFLIITVVDDSPADKAGLKGVSETYVVDGKEYPVDGDIIISVDDKEVRKISDILIHLQREKSVGDTMVLGVLRDGKFMHISLELVERPDL
jgi:S1-C subfamily serine protease